ncbi:MAG TPA: glycosyltransferase [Flavobacteriales bacterium]|nr:glycosyltransferase [Flavobacteriales bacterium]
MHILVLPKWYPGAPDPQLGDFIRKQMLAVASMHKVSVVHTCAVEGLAEPYRQDLDTSGGAWELHSYYRHDRIPLSSFRKAINFQRYRKAAMAGIERMLQERGKPDLIHAHILTRPAYAAWLLARKWDIPFVISEQSSTHLKGTWQQKHRAARYLDRFLYRQAAGSTAVSPHLAKALEAAGLGRNHAVVPNVIPGMNRPLSPAGPANHFMMVADLVDGVKNVSGVLNALALARSKGHDLKLEVIGGGADEEMLHAHANALGLKEHVVWHGRLPQAEVQPLMARMGTVIINSRFETFSVVTGEALACGKPVIATRCGGPEAFVTPENGLLIPVDDDQALCEAMIRMAQEHGRYAPHAIRASVGSRFSPEAVARGFDQVYQQVLKRGK